MSDHSAVSTAPRSCNTCGSRDHQSNNRSCPVQQQKKNLRSALDAGEVKGSIRIHLTNADGEDVFSDTVTVNFDIIHAVASASEHKDELHTRVEAIIHDRQNEEEADEAALKAEEARLLEQMTRQVNERRIQIASRKRRRGSLAEVNHPAAATGSNASQLSSARTNQSQSTTGMSGYTEDLSGFRAPSEASSYCPSEAVESVHHDRDLRPKPTEDKAAPASSASSLLSKASSAAQALASGYGLAKATGIIS